MSGGSRRRIDLAASLVGSPNVLVLDEPTTGLDPTARGALWDVVDELTAAGTTVVLTTQYLDEADRLADDILVLAHGRVVARGEPAELKRLVGDKIITATIPPTRVDRLLRIPDMRRVLSSDRVSVSFTAAGAATAADVVADLDRLGANVGVAAAIDHTNGLHDRFATVAMPRALPAVARTLDETVFTIGRAVLLVGAGAALLGFRFHGNMVDALAALIILVVLASAMSALFGAIGDRLRRPDVVQFAGMMLMMPLMFVSSAFAPLDTMPRWMQALAACNPVARATDALRGHVLGTATAADTTSAVAAATLMWVLVTVVPAGLRRRQIARGRR